MLYQISLWCTNSTVVAHPTTDIDIPPDCWTIHVDGSATEVNRGPGLSITSLEGSKLFYALKYTLFP